MSVILKAAQYAKRHHNKIERKYGCGPFINHAIRVSGAVALLDFATETMVAASWLHDVLEDPKADNSYVSEAELRTEFPDAVVDLVVELTNEKHSAALKRPERKALDHKRLSTVSREAKYIKALDRLDNISEIGGCTSKKFIKIYCDETVSLLDAIRVNEQQWSDIEQKIRLVLKSLKQLTDNLVD